MVYSNQNTDKDRLTKVHPIKSFAAHSHSKCISHFQICYQKHDSLGLDSLPLLEIMNFQKKLFFCDNLKFSEEKQPFLKVYYLAKDAFVFVEIFTVL